MSTPSSDIAAVSNRALSGSPFLVVTLNTLRKGMTPSAAMACNNLGAPAQRTESPSSLRKSKVSYKIAFQYLPACSAPGGGLLRGGGECLVPGGVSPPGRSPPGGGYIPACTEADPPVNRMTDACKNITLPQLRCGR